MDEQDRQDGNHFGFCEESFFIQKSGAEFTDDRRLEGDLNPILSIHVSSSCSGQVCHFQKLSRCASFWSAAKE